MEKGEYTVVLNPGEKTRSQDETWQNEIRLRIAPEKEWAKVMARRYHGSATEIYNALQKIKSSQK